MTQPVKKLTSTEFESSSSDEDNPEFKRERSALIRSFNRGMTYLLKEKGLNVKLNQNETADPFSHERADSMTSALSDDLVNIRTVHVLRSNSK